jgi:hypothetical protein
LRRWPPRPRRNGLGRPFVQLGNSKVEASFADARTYIYKGKEVDQQTHRFDLVLNANAGGSGRRRTVLNASWLGIYGNA